MHSVTFVSVHTQVCEVGTPYLENRLLEIPPGVTAPPTNSPTNLLGGGGSVGGGVGGGGGGGGGRGGGGSSVPRKAIA